MYSGSPQQMLDSLHSLMQSIMTLYKIARYYGTLQRMTILFQKITNQMMKGCKESILAAGKVWDQEKTALVASMRVRLLGGCTVKRTACSSSHSWAQHYNWLIRAVVKF